MPCRLGAVIQEGKTVAWVCQWCGLVWKHTGPNEAQQRMAYEMRQTMHDKIDALTSFVLSKKRIFPEEEK